MAGPPDDADEVSLAVADEVLGTIANEHRLKIVLVLGDVCVEGRYGTLRFSDIWEATGLEDSSRLNYHLQQLVEQDYVESVEEGYQLTLRGLKAYQAVKVGFYAKELEIEPFELEKDHEVCGEPLSAYYVDQRLTIACLECDDQIYRYPLPPGPFDAEATDEILEAWSIRHRIDIWSMSQGFCPYCSGPTRLEVGEEHFDLMDVEGWEAPALLFWCTHCHWFLASSMEKPFVVHPVVISFFADHGVNIWEVPEWSELLEVEDRLLSADPLEVVLEFSCEGDTLEVVVDEELNVLHTEERARTET